MANKIWSFIAGFFIAAACVVIGLWANLTIYGDPLAAAQVPSSIVDGTTILLTTLFIGLSGGHYIGGSFDKDSMGRWFALGANVVLWLIIVGLIGLQASSGGSVIRTAIYGSVLFLAGGSIFALHRSGLVENQSRLDQFIGQFSSKGTALIVISSFVVRTAPDPTLAGMVAAIVIIVGFLLLNAYGEYLDEGVEKVETLVEDYRTTEEK